jgi:hypothetical protein
MNKKTFMDKNVRQEERELTFMIIILRVNVAIADRNVALQNHMVAMSTTVRAYDGEWRYPTLTSTSIHS